MLYIKFKEWDIKSLKIACREAERLGYVKYPNKNAIDFEWLWLLCLEDWEYFTVYSYKKAVILREDEHHKINPLRKLYYYLTT